MPVVPPRKTFRAFLTYARQNWRYGLLVFIGISGIVVVTASKLDPSLVNESRRRRAQEEVEKLEFSKSVLKYRQLRREIEQFEKSETQEKERNQSR
jgi:hypothetical protein